jgi:D-sedoheptulose 7-phosphate isomerase
MTVSMSTGPTDAAHEFVASQFRQSIELPSRFFAENADRVSQTCFAMARRFQRGGRLLVFGNGSSTTDAQHVSVEFVHPVIVGKRALPALALTNDIASVLGLMQTAGLDEIYAQQLRLLGTRDDMALGLTVDGDDASVMRGLQTAGQMGMMAIGMCGAGSTMALAPGIDHCFAVPSSDPHVVQEVQETTYHILWETVHVFFEHKGLLEQ